MRLLEKIAILIAISCLISPAVAKEKPPQIRTDLLAVSFGKPLHLYYRDSQGISKLDIFSTGIGSPVYYKGEAVLHFYKRKQDLAPPKEGVAPPIPAASVKLSAGNRRTLLVFVTNNNQVNTKVYGISDAQMKAGDYYLFNFSKFPIAARIGQGVKPIQIAPSSTYITNDRALRNKRMDLPVIFFSQEKGKKYRRVYSSVWGHSHNQRTFLFMADTGNPKKPIAFRRYRETPSVNTVPR
ncbi:MAG: hypothetical protein AB8F34_05520 [Akkermansiaceae bacterium]